MLGEAFWKVADGPQTTYNTLPPRSTHILFAHSIFSPSDERVPRGAPVSHHLTAILNVHALNGDPQNTKEIEYNLRNGLMESLPSTVAAIL